MPQAIAIAESTRRRLMDDSGLQTLLLSDDSGLQTLLLGDLAYLEASRTRSSVHTDTHTIQTFMYHDVNPF